MIKATEKFNAFFVRDAKLVRLPVMFWESCPDLRMLRAWYGPDPRGRHDDRPRRDGGSCVTGVVMLDDILVDAADAGGFIGYAKASDRGATSRMKKRAAVLRSEQLERECKEADITCSHCTDRYEQAKRELARVREETPSKTDYLKKMEKKEKERRKKLTVAKTEFKAKRRELSAVREGGFSALAGACNSKDDG